MSSASLPASAASPWRLLAIETSTDRLSVAVGHGANDGNAVIHDGPGAAQSSATLLPVVSDALARRGWALAELDAIVFARGPGSFTGLRTACAIAQGLAYGAQNLARPGGIPVLPVDTLLALAEEARWQREAAGKAPARCLVALLDARMGEMYVAVYAVDQQGLVNEPLQAPVVCAPSELAALLRAVAAATAEGLVLAGNVFEVYAAELADVPGERQVALPTAQALLRLAPGLLAAGLAVAAHEAMPLYVRDKVAKTTDEREQLRLAQMAAVETLAHVAGSS
ncbi:MAG: tRNA (adenosine(37)-N6)-threonylcarbamoyltransferase complex dimerization subunit type 1 TsaB [Hydrogenophaga sp.]